eukprot:CFRG2469T1
MVAPSEMESLFLEYIFDEKRKYSLYGLNSIEKILKGKREACDALYKPIATPEGRLGPKVVTIDKENAKGCLKLSGPNKLQVESLSRFLSFRGSVCVYKGKWMYEVTLITSGIQQIGWATIDCVFSNEHGVGDEIDSFSYDGCRLKKWNVKPETYGETWVQGDTLGIMIDCDEGQISYCRNGKHMGVAFSGIRHHERGLAFFPALSMSHLERCEINFGHNPFRYPVAGYIALQIQTASVSAVKRTSASSRSATRNSEGNGEPGWGEAWGGCEIGGYEGMGNSKDMGTQEGDVVYVRYLLECYTRLTTLDQCHPPSHPTMSSTPESSYNSDINRDTRDTHRSVSPLTDTSTHATLPIPALPPPETYNRYLFVALGQLMNTLIPLLLSASTMERVFIPYMLNMLACGTDSQTDMVDGVGANHMNLLFDHIFNFADETEQRTIIECLFRSLSTTTRTTSALFHDRLSVSHRSNYLTDDSSTRASNITKANEHMNTHCDIHDDNDIVMTYEKSVDSTLQTTAFNGSFSQQSSHARTSNTSVSDANKMDTNTIISAHAPHVRLTDLEALSLACMLLSRREILAILQRCRSFQDILGGLLSSWQPGKADIKHVYPSRMCMTCVNSSSHLNSQLHFTHTPTCNDCCCSYSRDNMQANAKNASASKGEGEGELDDNEANGCDLAKIQSAWDSDVDAYHIDRHALNVRLCLIFLNDNSPLWSVPAHHSKSSNISPHTKPTPVQRPEQSAIVSQYIPSATTSTLTNMHAHIQTPQTQNVPVEQDYVDRDLATEVNSSAPIFGATPMSTPLLYPSYSSITTPGTQRISVLSPIYPEQLVRPRFSSIAAAPTLVQPRAVSTASTPEPEPESVLHIPCTSANTNATAHRVSFSATIPTTYSTPTRPASLSEDQSVSLNASSAALQRARARARMVTQATARLASVSGSRSSSRSAAIEAAMSRPPVTPQSIIMGWLKEHIRLLAKQRRHVEMTVTSGLSDSSLDENLFYALLTIYQDSHAIPSDQESDTTYNRDPSKLSEKLLDVFSSDMAEYSTVDRVGGTFDHVRKTANGAEDHELGEGESEGLDLEADVESDQAQTELMDLDMSDDNTEDLIDELNSLSGRRTGSGLSIKRSSKLASYKPSAEAPAKMRVEPRLQILHTLTVLFQLSVTGRYQQIESNNKYLKLKLRKLQALRRTSRAPSNNTQHSTHTTKTTPSFKCARARQYCQNPLHSHNVSESDAHSTHNEFSELSTSKTSTHTSLQPAVMARRSGRCCCCCGCCCDSSDGTRGKRDKKFKDVADDLLSEDVSTCLRMKSWQMKFLLNEDRKKSLVFFFMHLVRLLNNFSKSKLFPYVPELYVESSINSYRSLMSGLGHKILENHDVWECGDLLLQFMTNFGNIGVVASPGLREKMIKCLSFSLSRKGCQALCENSTVVREVLVNKLLEAFKTRFWILITPILIRFYFGHIPSEIEEPWTDCEQSCGSEVFQKRFELTCSADQQLAVDFVNHTFNHCNWAVSELCVALQSVLQRLRTGQHYELQDCRFIQEQTQKSMVFAELTMSLFRLLEITSRDASLVFTRIGSVATVQMVELVAQLIRRAIRFEEQEDPCIIDTISTQFPALLKLQQEQILTVVTRCILNLHPSTSGHKQSNSAVQSTPSSISIVDAIVSYDLDFSSTLQVRLTSLLETGYAYNSGFNKTVKGNSDKEDIHDMYDAVPSEKLSTFLADLASAHASKVNTNGENVGAEDDDEDANTCSICYTFPLNTTFLPCRHQSCQQCITRHLLNSRACFFCKDEIETIETAD